MGPMARKAASRGARAKRASAKATARKKRAAGKRPALKKSRMKKPYPELKASRETFESVPREPERPRLMRSLAAPERMPRLSLSKQMAAARKDGSMLHAATALIGAAAVAAVAGAVIFLVAGFELIVAAGIIAPLFIATSIILYSRLEGTGKK